MIQKHECVHKEYDAKVMCYLDYTEKRLILTLYDPAYDPNQTNIENFVCHVKFCPFCGFRSDE